MTSLWQTFSQAKDLKGRLLFTLVVLVLYRFCSYVPLPGVNPEALAYLTQKHAGGLLGMLDMFSGGALSRTTIMTLNLMPYISASIIVQLLSSVVPSFEALRKEGDLGRVKLNQYTRYGTIILACVQGYAVALFLEGMEGAVLDPGLFFRLTVMVTLLGATLLLVWMGEQISSRGIGNGSSLIIYTGIVANLPQSAGRMLYLAKSQAFPIWGVLFVLLGLVLVTIFVVFVERSHRKIFFYYPRSQSPRGEGGQQDSSHMPIKVNTTGVIPPIFSNSLLALPLTFLGFLAAKEGMLGQYAAVFLRYCSHGTLGFVCLNSALIIFFSFFYASIVFNTQEMAENLKKNGAFILGYRPGVMTQTYLSHVVNRLTVVGALYLAFLCAIPEAIMSQVSLPFYFSGTSLLILVGVALDTLEQVNSALMSHRFEHLLRKGKKRKVIRRR